MEKNLNYIKPLENEGLLVHMLLCCKFCLPIDQNSKQGFESFFFSENLKAFDGIINVKYILKRRKVPDFVQDNRDFVILQEVASEIYREVKVCVIKAL